MRSKCDLICPLTWALWLTAKANNLENLIFRWIAIAKVGQVAIPIKAFEEAY